MPEDTDVAALMIDPSQVAAALAQLAAGGRGVTVSGRVSGASNDDQAGLALHLQDVLLHLGPVPTRTAHKSSSSAPSPESTG